MEHTRLHVSNAMFTALKAHSTQIRKFTGEPYFSHLAEVAGVVSAFSDDWVTHASAWLHDIIEDQGFTHAKLAARFGNEVADTVQELTDVEVGNSKERHAGAVIRLGNASARAQNVKCADILSNTKSIAMHDPMWALNYIPKKLECLAAMTKAEPQLRDLAMNIAKQQLATIEEARVKVWLAERSGALNPGTVAQQILSVQPMQPYAQHLQTIIDANKKQME